MYYREVLNAYLENYNKSLFKKRKIKNSNKIELIKYALKSGKNITINGLKTRTQFIYAYSSTYTLEGKHYYYYVQLKENNKFVGVKEMESHDYNFLIKNLDNHYFNSCADGHPYEMNLTLYNG